MSDHFKDSFVVQTSIEAGSDKSSFRPREEIPHRVLHNCMVIDEESNNNNHNKAARPMMMMTKSTVAAIHHNDYITKTPVLSPPSSPELEICPDKGIYGNNNENDDDDDDVFQYKEKHQDDPLSESPKHFKITTTTKIKQEQESLDHESTSINYFYRDFDTDKKKNNENNADLVLQQQQQQQQLLPENEFIIKNSMTKNVPDYQSIITTPIDLTGFAQELYDNRLSIVHSRESKLILTEQDELELAKLMEIRRKSQAIARQQQNDEKITQWPPLPTTMTTSTLTQEEEEYACEKIEWNETIQKDLLPSLPVLEKEIEILSSVSDNFVTIQQQQSLIITTNNPADHDLGATLMESSCSSSQATSSPVTTPVTHNTSNIISDSNSSTIITTPIARSSLPSVSPKSTRSRGFSLQKLRNPIENTTSWLPKKKLVRLSDNSDVSASSSTSSSSFKSTKQQHQQHDIYDDSDKILVEEEEEKTHKTPTESTVEQEPKGEKRPSISTRSKSSSNASRSSRFKELMDMDLSHVATDIGTNKEPPPPPAPTNDQQQQSSSSSPISNSSTLTSDINQPSGPSRSMSLNLFGSLRSRARSQSTSSIKGLMRNFSTTNVIPQRNNSINQQQQSQTQQGLKKKQSHSALSPAALAVLKHNAQGHNKKKGSGNNNNNTSTTTTTSTITTTNYEDESTINNNQSKGKRLLSQLLSTARLSRRGPKKVNMGQDNSYDNRKKTRAQIVRRTIIYVQPDSENFLYNIEKNHIPPTPSPTIPSRYTFSTTGQKLQRRSLTPDSDEDQGSQQTATMITRQPSIKRQVSKRHNSNNHNTNNYDEQQQQQQQLEGVEVREMSDGTVVWGVVKKLGKRKSFFVASEDSCGYESKLQVNEAQDEINGEEEIDDDDDEDEDQIEERVLALMGLSPDLLKNYPNNDNYESAITTTASVVAPPPIPKRSPHRLREQELQQQQQQRQQQQLEQATYISSYANRRDSSTTDVYYAHGATLPSLLEMIASDQQELSPKENPTVEEQLDEVMRSLGYTEDHIL